MDMEYKCSCNCTFGDYSDHDQNCPIWLIGRITSLEFKMRLLDVDLLAEKQRTCLAQERAYHWEKCFVKRELKLGE